MQKICDSAGFVVKPQSARRNAVDLFESGDLAAALDATHAEIPEAESLTQALELWYVRVQCLLTLQYKVEATREIDANLGILDDSKDEYAEFRNQLDTPRARLNSWRLRLLLVPVRVGRINQATVQKYYAMAFEARSESELALKDEWMQAVKLAGTYAVAALVILKDYISAAELLEVQYRAAKDEKLARWLCLLHIMVGDTLGAHSWMTEVSDGAEQQRLTDLINFAESDHDIGAISLVYGGELDAVLHPAESKQYTAKQLSEKINAAVLAKMIEIKNK